MAFTQAAVHAFDCLGTVHIAVTVHQSEGHGDPNSLVLQQSTTVEGTGETDPREWLRDALVAMLEAL